MFRNFSFILYNCDVTTVRRLIVRIPFRGSTRKQRWPYAPRARVSFAIGPGPKKRRHRQTFEHCKSYSRLSHFKCKEEIKRSDPRTGGRHRRTAGVTRHRRAHRRLLTASSVRLLFCITLGRFIYFAGRHQQRIKLLCGYERLIHRRPLHGAVRVLRQFHGQRVQRLQVFH